MINVRRLDLMAPRAEVCGTFHATSTSSKQVSRHEPQGAVLALVAIPRHRRMAGEVGTCHLCFYSGTLEYFLRQLLPTSIIDLIIVRMASDASRGNLVRSSIVYVHSSSPSPHAPFQTLPSSAELTSSGYASTSQANTRSCSHTPWAQICAHWALAQSTRTPASPRTPPHPPWS